MDIEITKVENVINEVVRIETDAMILLLLTLKLSCCIYGVNSYNIPAEESTQ